MRWRKRSLALDQIWLFSKFFVAKCWWGREVLLEVSMGLGRGGAIGMKGITEQNEQSKKICSDVTW